MADDKTLGHWPDLPPHPGALMDQIRAIAKADDGRVAFAKHAFDRQDERLAINEINDQDVIRGLRIGDVVSKIAPGRSAGEWKCRVSFPYGAERGTREVGVALVVDQGEEILVVTVLWEDRR